jgi:hypothetical protein
VNEVQRYRKMPYQAETQGESEIVRVVLLHRLRADGGDDIGDERRGGDHAIIWSRRYGLYFSRGWGGAPGAVRQQHELVPDRLLSARNSAAGIVRTSSQWSIRTSMATAAGGRPQHEEPMAIAGRR